jgi:isopenicillin N synthase-like dioxygenase
MEAIALSLGQSAHYFRDLFGPTPYYRLKAAKYPSVKNTKAATIGCGAHKDTGFLTVLLQDMVGGLQGQIPATGEWMDTRPVPETFIVTMGEAMERMTGGLYQATVHRVLNNTSGQDRYSIPFFFDPSLDTRVPSQIEGLDRSTRLDFSNAQTREELPIEAFCGLGITTQDNVSLPATGASSSRQAAAAVDVEEHSWSSGAHVFETVHRCHPEVYARWYTCEE